MPQGEKAELFARRARPGWHQWGRELPGGEEHPVSLVPLKPEPQGELFART